MTLTLLSSGRPSLTAIPWASSGLELPANSLILGIVRALASTLALFIHSSLLCIHHVGGAWHAQYSVR